MIKKRIAHAYIFHGPSGTGRMQMAIEFAKAINCQQSSHDACDTCPTCRTIAHGNHPDVVILHPDGSFIKMEQIRELKSRFMYSPPKDFTRIVILVEAEKMRSEAANSLLKFLEDPSSPMLAILITENEHAILPTIRSRCQIIRFHEVPAEKKKEAWLNQGAPESLAWILSHLSIDFNDSLDFKELSDIISQTIHWGEQILNKNTQALLFPAESWMKNVDSPIHSFILDVLLLWLRDIMYEQQGIPCRIFPHEKEKLNHLAKTIPSTQLLLAMDNVLIARRLLSKQQLSHQGIFEQLVLAILDQRLITENDWQLIKI